MKEFNEKKTIVDKLKYIMPLSKISGCKILANSEVVENFLKKDIAKNFKIILLIREDIDKLRNSMKKAGFRSYKYVNLEGENKSYRRMGVDNKNVYLLSYEDIVGKTQRFKRLFEFIGVGYDEKRVSSGMGEVCSYASSLV